MTFKELRWSRCPAGDLTEVREKVMKNDAGEIVAKIAAEFERDGAQSKVTLELEGTFLLEQVVALDSFLNSVNDGRVEHWVLRLNELKRMDAQAWITLLGYASALKRRGGRVEISGVHAAAEHVLLAAWLIARLRDRHKTSRSR